MSQRVATLLFGSALWIACNGAWAQVDPGVRGGLANTGGGLQQQGIAIPHPPLISPNPKTHATVNDNERVSFEEGILRAGQLESTCDDCADVTDGSLVPGELDPAFPQIRTNSTALGPGTMPINASSAMRTRHWADPAASSSPTRPIGLRSRRKIRSSASCRIAFGRQNAVPSFEQQYGPIREVRFKYNPDGSRDGGVHQLWTVRGSTNDPTISGCALQQPDFEAEYRAGNLAFRIPLQMLGLGLIESIPDREILGHHAATAPQRAGLGIGGHPNRSGNDGTITRFGWKAQNKSLVVFAGEAYIVEMGITNDVFPTPTEEDPACQGSNKPAPNDILRTDSSDARNQSFDNPLHIVPDWLQFMMLMRFTDGPAPDPNPSASARHGAAVFTSIGCTLCHTPQLQTAPVMNSAVLQDRPVNLFSDLMVHHMGANLADNVVQGQAGPDEFRSTPLWGVGQRIFFLHDGRTSDLLQAIRAHFSPSTPGDADEPQGSVLTRLFAGSSTPHAPAYGASEANAVIRRFNDLTVADQQAVLDFLRSL